MRSLTLHALFGVSGEMLIVTVAGSGKTLTVTGSTFTGASDLFSAGILAASEGGTMTVNVSGSTFTNNQSAVAMTYASGGVLSFDIDGNTVTLCSGDAFGVNAASLATGSGAGRFRNNIIGNPGVASSGSSAGSAIRIDNNAILAIPVVVSITGNTIQGIGSVGTGQPGIYSTYGGIGGLGRTSAVTITGNTIRDVYNSNGVFIEQPGPGSTCANISGNTFSNVAGVSGDGAEIRLRNTTATAFNVTQTDPAGAADPNRLDTANGLTPADISVSGTVSFNQTPCVIP